ncbi:MAG: hypothetical protein ACAH80_05355 [Alphaproteobacteria bacterium]
MQTSTTDDFNAKAKPPQTMDAEDYRMLLEKLLATGKGYGKTERVVAYELSDIILGTEKMVKKKLVESEERVEVEKLYLVMDIKQWPNAYVRRLGMREIGSLYMARMAGEQQINAHDFKAPGLWTSKKKAFEGDYTATDELDENGNHAFIYKPNHDAFRLCMKVTHDMTIPVKWGTYMIGKGGMLAVRQEHVESLAAALEDIRSGKTTAEKALFTTDREGKRVTEFDVYGMDPGFLESNYKPVKLAPETEAVSEHFAERQPKLTMRTLRLKSSSVTSGVK